VYGGGAAAEPLSVSTSEFLKMWRKAGESTVVTLSVDGDTSKSVLIHDIAFDPVTNDPLHVDFYEVVADRLLKTNIPLHFVGEAPAIKVLGGVLTKVMHEVEVEALPKDLPHEIEVDISSLATFSDHILLKHIALPTGVTLIGEPDATVAKIIPPRTDEEIAALKETVAVDLETIEVAKKGKKEEEAEAEEAAPATSE